MLVFLIVIFVLIGLFAFIWTSNTSVDKINSIEITKTENYSQSDDLSDIEKDLDETYLDNVDLETTLIEKELDGVVDEL